MIGKPCSLFWKAAPFGSRPQPIVFKMIKNSLPSHDVSAICQQTPTATKGLSPGNPVLEIGDGYELDVTTDCIFIVMLNFMVATLRILHK